MSLLDKSAMTSRDNLVRRLMKTRRNGAGGHNAESGPASGHAALSPNESEAGGVAEAESQSRIGYLDFFSEGQVVGWMYDPAQAVSLAKIFVDDLCIGIVSCDEERNDVVASGYPASTRGFRHDLPAEFLDGDRHELKVTFLDGEPLRISNGFESKKSLTFQSNFIPEFLGNVDGIEGDLVSGWLLMQNRAGGKKTGGGKIAIYCDGILAGQVRASESRPDVADHFKSETYCGFTFQIPSTFLRPSTRVEVATFPHRWTLPGSPLTVERLPTTERAQLRMLERNLERISIDLWRTKREIRKITAAPIWMLPAYGDWASIYFADLRRRAPRARERSTPTVSVLCPVYRPRLRDFVAAIDSVVAQTYPHWELVIVDDCSGREDLTAAIDHYAARDPRVKVHRHSANKGISDATNTAIAAATGDLIAFFDHDDLLVDCALDFMVDALVSSQAIMAYSDEDKIDDRGTLSEPNFKSDWNLRLMLAQNYVCHLVVVRRDAVLRAGPFSTKYNGAQDHDFILRLSEVIGDNAIRHVPEVLYHWRKTPNSTAETVSNKTYAIDAGVAVVADYLVRNRIEAQVTSRGAMTNYIIGWPRRAKIDVSIIVPLKDNAALTRRCLKALRANTEQAGVEIILVNNFSLDAETAEFLHEAAQMEHVRVLDVEEPFNYSRINNIAVASCQSEYILFLNNDVIVDDRDWLDQLVGELCWRGDVGAVGCKLLYESGKVQHAGVVLGVGDGRVAEHPFRGLEPHDPGFMGRALCSQEYSAVTAACLLTRRDVFDEVGGFDEADLAVAFNDVDLCLKIRKAGYRVVWRAETKLEHRESASRSSDMGEHKLPRFIDEHHVMHARWGDELANDPFYNRNFSRDLGVFKAMRIID